MQEEKMKSLYKLFFGVAALVLAAVLSLSGGCAEIPAGAMPDPEVPAVDTIIAADTAIFGDTVAICVTTLIGGDTASVVCDTVFLGRISVPYTVTRAAGEINGYCLYPITFKASPSAADLGYIEAIYLDLGGRDADGAGPALLAPPAYSAVFTYADTGRHAARMLVVMRGGGLVLTEEFEVRTAVRIDSIRPISISVSDTGSLHTFTAGGYRYSGVYWVWDLTNIAAGVVRTLQDSVGVFVRGEHDTTVSVYQEDSLGRRTPGRDVRFVSAIDAEYTVVVGVEGGEAVISPDSVFSVPYGGGVSVTVDVGGQVNTRIDRVTVNGEPMYVYGDSLVVSTVLEIRDIRSNVRVAVFVAAADTVTPAVTLEWPLDSGNMADCASELIAYRLNKKMASGYIMWRFHNIAGGVIPGMRADSTIIVDIPRDVVSGRHVVGNRFYETPRGYLDEGLQKYSQNISPRLNKWNSMLSVGTTYTITLGFTDSLGRASNTVRRMVGITSSPSTLGCGSARRMWEEME
jgi:hypothetical protein